MARPVKHRPEDDPQFGEKAKAIKSGISLGEYAKRFGMTKSQARRQIEQYRLLIEGPKPEPEATVERRVIEAASHAVDDDVRQEKAGKKPPRDLVVIDPREHRMRMIEEVKRYRGQMEADGDYRGAVLAARVEDAILSNHEDRDKANATQDDDADTMRLAEFVAMIPRKGG